MPLPDLNQGVFDFSRREILGLSLSSRTQNKWSPDVIHSANGSLKVLTMAAKTVPALTARVSQLACHAGLRDSGEALLRFCFGMAYLKNKNYTW